MNNYNNRNIHINNQSMINNYYSKSFEDHNYSQNNNDEYKYKNKKPFIERPGDWICFNCHNINFAFRTKCNRCQITKNINQILVNGNHQLMFINN